MLAPDFEVATPVGEPAGTGRSVYVGALESLEHTIAMATLPNAEEL
jgi:hypothetical protein